MGKSSLENSRSEKLRSFAKSPFAKSKFAKPDDTTAQPAFRLKRILYPATRATLILTTLTVFSIFTGAQEDRPEIKPQDKVLNKKKRTGEPRAVGLLQLNAKGKATLVPIAILINGKFYDAAAYKADPVPMALETGTVYEGEKTGSSLGLFTVNGALHTRDANAANPWIGTGQWLLQGAEGQKKALKAETVPVGMETSDAPPRLTKGAKAPNSATPDSASSAGGSQPTLGADTKKGTQPTDTKASDPKPSDQKPADTDRPTLGRKSQDQKPDPSTSSPTSPPPTGSSPEAGKTKSTEPAKSDTAAPAPGEDTNSDAGASGRPKLRRGKPTEPLPSDTDIPGYAKPGETKPASVAEAKPDATSKPDEKAVPKTPVQLLPAISDEAGPDPRSFVFEWDKSEAATRTKQVLAFAQEQLHAYINERAKSNIPAKSSVKATPGSKRPTATKTKAADLVLEDLQIRTFDLWTNNQPVIVLTAKAHPPLPAVGTAEATTAPEYTIALVARTDIYNNLHKLHVGITDKYHLDVTPRLELIDAVDADGDGRGELLFHETSETGSGYIIYRASADTLWKMFDSLSPQ